MIGDGGLRRPTTGDDCNEELKPEAEQSGLAQSTRFDSLSVNVPNFSTPAGALLRPWQQVGTALDVANAGQMSGEEIARRQSGRLADLLTVAREHSKFYRESLADARIDMDSPVESLGGLPPVSRHALMQGFDDWCTDSRLTRSVVQAFIADTSNIGKQLFGDYFVWESSGTHGEPGFFVQDAQTMAVYDALEGLRRSSARWFDPFMLGERIAFVGATGGHFASYVTIERLRQLNPWFARTVQSFSLMQPSGALVDALNAFAPTVITTYPTAAALLADQARAGALRVRPREVWTGGETLSPAVREHVASSLGCTIRNSYGASEFLPIAWECSQGHLHANTDWVILEPVDVHMRPVAAGHIASTTLLTNLANHIQPLIRYDVGDCVRLVKSPCACGSSLPVIEVEGRHDDALVMEGSAGQAVTVLPLALMTAIEDDAGVFDFQVRQRDTRTLVLRLPPDIDDSAGAMRRCRKALRAFAANQDLAPIQLVGETGRALVYGRSGKVQRIIACNTNRFR